MKMNQKKQHIYKYEHYTAVGGDEQQRLNIPTLGFPGDNPQCVCLPGPSSEDNCDFDNLSNHTVTWENLTNPPFSFEKERHVKKERKIYVSNE